MEPFEGGVLGVEMIEYGADLFSCTMGKPAVRD
jgi:hypothetical protein